MFIFLEFVEYSLVGLCNEIIQSCLQVNLGSVVERSGLFVGDGIFCINDINVDDFLYEQVKMCIIWVGNIIIMIV